jgi:hypothetical protein
MAIASPGTIGASSGQNKLFEIGTYLASRGSSDVILDEFGTFEDD